VTLEGVRVGGAAVTDWANFDRFIGIDWSGAAKPSNCSIFVADGRPDGNKIQVTTLTRAASREAVEIFLRGENDLARHKQWEPEQRERERWPAPARLSRDERVLVGLDFAFGFADGFAQHLAGRGTMPWKWAAAADEAPSVDKFIRDDEGSGWFRLDKGQNLPDEPFRLTEGRLERKPASVFDLKAASKQVGLGSIRGMAMLDRLGEQVQVWPFQKIGTSTAGRRVLVEMYPAMWLTPGAAKSHLPVRVAEVQQLRKRLEFNTDVEYAAVGDDNALDALAILDAFARCLPAEGLRKDLPLAAKREGWIWGVDPADAAK
jgi:hypothetical protein